MRICVLQSSYEGTESALQDADDTKAQPGLFTTEHTFEYRFIHKATAKEEIDALAAEGFDFYFNFMWGTPDDPVAGVQASRYFESLNLPSYGIRSWEHSMSKNDFHQIARLRGAPPVPETDRLPHFKAFAESYDPESYSDDIVVQECIDGQDYGCTVIQMRDACIALAPYKFVTKEGQRLVTFEMKFDDETHFELLRKKDDPAFFQRLQKVAIEAFLVSGCQGSDMGCDVDLRARNGDVVVIDVNPQPANFIPKGPFQDLPILHSLPGGHSALIHIYIANYLLRNAAQQGVSEQIAEEYDSFASQYDTMIAKTSTIAAGMKALTDSYEFDGTIFDLACGTGVFGQSMEEALINCHRFAERVDHIVCFSALHLLRPEIFTFVLVLCFTLARKSITISIDEITDVYNKNMEKTGLGFMYSRNYLAGILAFGEPPNWRLTKRATQYSWSSATTGDEIYTTYFRFDRIGESQDLMFKGIEVPN